MRTAPKLKKCSERLTDSCSTETDGCCSIIPCTYCLLWEVYGEDDQAGNAEFIGGQWIGDIAGATFAAFWRREYGECRFIIELDGDEIYNKSCYEGASCKDSTDSIETTIGYESGTLRWTKYEPKPLPLTTVDNCRVHFCGDCDCICKVLCYSLNRNNTSLDLCKGEMSINDGYDCDAPTWSTTVTCGGTTYNLELSLDREEYTGECVLTLSNGLESLSELISDCQSLAADFHLADGSILTVNCKKCHCPRRTGCCPNLSETLYATVSGTVIGDPFMACPTYTVDGVIEIRLITEGPAAIWYSAPNQFLTTTTCSSSFPVTYYAGVTCGPDINGQNNLTLTIADNPSLTTGVIWKAVYSGCNGGIKDKNSDGVIVAGFITITVSLSE